MRVSREQFAQNRQKILTAAGELFLDKGFSGIGVAEVMKAAGFTHGGFYGHFDSKEQLTYETCKTLLVRTKESWKQIIGSNPDAPLEALFGHYLSVEKLFSTDGPCVFAKLSQELSRHDADIRQVFSQGLTDLRDTLIEILPASNDAEREQRALSILNAMIGAVSLARATNDSAFAEALLSAARQKLMQDLKS